MNDFDQLLSDVLDEDGGIQPPSGIEKRILASLSIKAKAFPTRSRKWIGIAATALVGLSMMGALMLSRRPAPIGTAAKSPLMVSLVPAPRKIDVLKPESFRSASALESINPSLHKKMNRHSKSYSQHDVVRVNALEIGSLIIEPIEIASLIPKGLAMKGSAQ